MANRNISGPRLDVYRRGYTLLFAVLTAALVLGVAVFILDISRKQYELSVSARDSMYSFYAADSGIECALLAFNSGPATVSSTTATMISCAGQSEMTSIVPSPQGVSFLTSNVKQVQIVWPITIIVNGVTQNECTEVVFTTGKDSNNQKWSVIQSRGYNFCTTNNPIGPDTLNSNTVERALELSYNGAWLW